jgi:uncharacterized membrane protein YhaH (DUF805 family)
LRDQAHRVKKKGGSMGFGQSISAFWSNYANFNDRARRSEYWFTYLFWTLVYLGALIIDAVIGTAVIIAGLWALATLIPLLSSSVRRLHDTGKSGWYLLMGLIPFAGGIILLVFFLQDSVGPNAYGSNPKEVRFN